MKDNETIFIENLKSISDSLNKGDFASCFKSVQPLTVFCNYTENPEYVFICELLEGIFSQVGPIIDGMEIPDEELKSFLPLMQKVFADLIGSIERKDKNEMFKSLVTLRFIATQFQLKWNKIGKPKPSKKGSGMPIPFDEMMKRILVK